MPTIKPRAGLAQFPEYSSAYVRLNAIKLEKVNDDREIDRLRQLVLEKDASSHREAHSDIRRQALAMTEGASELKPQGPSAQELQDQLDKKLQRRPILVEAIEIQRRVCENLQQRLSTEISKAARPEYAAIVGRMAAAVKALMAAAQEEDDFRDDMRQGDVLYNAHIHPMVMSAFRVVKDECDSSHAMRWLKEARENFPELGL